MSKQRKRILQNGLLVLLSLTAVTLLAVAADRMLPLLFSRILGTPDLVYPSFLRAVHITDEFSYTVETNSLGFRDVEFGPKRQDTTRVIALGDSFTYGWGVDLEDSWVKVLEKLLREKGLSIEIANLGRAGADPRAYADIAEKAVPLLHPDHILVGVLQGGDIGQLARDTPSGEAPGEGGGASPSLFDRFESVIGPLCPNSIRLIKRLEFPDEIRRRTDSQTKRLMKGLSGEKKAAFMELDAEIQEALLHGGLSPFLIHAALDYPEYFIQALDPANPGIKAGIDSMAGALRRIEAVADRIGARVWVFSIPYGAYVSERSFATRERLGFHVDKSMLTSNAPDAAIEEACRTAGIPFFSVTAEFREECRLRPLFFELDGHFSADGYRFFAESIVTIVEPILRPQAGEGT